MNFTDPESQMKNKGWVRLWLRGLDKAEAEWTLHCMGHNLCKAASGMGVMQGQCAAPHSSREQGL